MVYCFQSITSTCHLHPEQSLNGKGLFQHEDVGVRIFLVALHEKINFCCSCFLLEEM